MSRVLEIEKALGQLPREERWEIARWLLQDLQEGASVNLARPQDCGPVEDPFPDYAARRRQIFGSKVLPNMVLAARAEEPW